jgi:hypothetical protein
VDLKSGRQFDTEMSRVRREIRDRIKIDPGAERGRGYALSLLVLGMAGLPAKADAGDATGSGAP